MATEKDLYKIMMISVTWLGHSTFLFTIPEGKTILVDPWVQNNPMCPAALKKLKAVDLMLITHAHFDHIGDAVHSCGIQDGSQITYGGEAAGYVIKFSNGRIFYHSGDTALFGSFPLLTGRPAALREFLAGGGAQGESKIKVIEFKPGETRTI